MIEYYDDVDEEGIPYRCEVDVALYDDAPIEDSPFLLWIFVNVQDSTGKVFEQFRLDLIETLHSQLGAVYAGTISKEGWCELYFYAMSAKSHTNLTAQTISRHTPYAYECSASRDAKWEFYFERLYPSAHAALKIQNRHTIDALVEAGDDLSIVREVEHYLFFQTKSSMERGISNLQPHGFELKETLFDDDSDYSYGVVLLKEETIEPDQVEETTSILFDVALQEHGHYEGWSTILAQ